jgi:hypothetical protein
MEPGLREYFDRIEAAFGRRRGAPLLLSPLDFEKAVEWYAAGVPPEVVEMGVAAYFERLERRKVHRRHAICLSFAERDILKALEARRAADVGKTAGLPEAPPFRERALPFLQGRAALLRSFASDPARRSECPVLCRFAEAAASEIEALAAAEPIKETALERALEPLDRELCRLALLDGPPELAEEWRRQALERLGDLAATLEGRSLEQTVERLAAQAALRHWGLKRLSLLYLE